MVPRSPKGEKQDVQLAFPASSATAKRKATNGGKEKHDTAKLQRRQEKKTETRGAGGDESRRFGG